MTGWHEGWLTGFDTETSGTDIETDRIVTATVVHIKGVQVEKREWLINPGVPISPEASAIHGVTDEVAKRDGVHPATAVAQIFSELDDAWTAGHVVVAFNAAFDLSILDRELRRHCGIPSLADVIGPVIDPMCIDRALDPYRRGSRKLGDVCAHYKVRLDQAHDASEDALAACRLAWRMAQVYPEQLGDLTAVNGRQTEWRRGWADGFRAYLKRQGKDSSDVRGDWPLVPFVPTPACESVEA